MQRIRSALLAAVLASLAAAQDPAAGSMDKVRALEQKFAQLREQMQKDFEALEKIPESEREAKGDKIYADFQSAAGEIGEQLVAIATADGAEVGFAAALAALHVNLSKAQRASVIEALSEHHAAGGAIVAALPGLRYVGGKSVDSLLKKVISDNPKIDAKGIATLVLAQRGKDETLLEECVARFADVVLGDDKVGAIAGRMLFALRNLKIGGTAPDIDGRDMDGTAFKLSDYRGKVVVLDFWGFW